MDTGMNELIKDLSLAAGGSHYPTINPALQRRFAELIVEHIVRRINDEIDLATEQEQVYAAGALQTLTQQILQDFGMTMPHNWDAAAELQKIIDEYEQQSPNQ